MIAYGYRVPFDASAVLKQLEAGSDVWEKLWDELHHQGDLGEASYASVPHLVRIAKSAERRDWNVYALVALIEVERHREGNPTIPGWLQADYESAWREITAMALLDLAAEVDSLTLRSALSVVALARSDRKLGALLSHFDSSGIDELAEERLSWSDLYG